MQLFNGDSLEILDQLEENSIDSVVCDPPYGLGNNSKKVVEECLKAWMNEEAYQASGAGFMGKAWDSFVPGPEIWRKVFRVLKPGGHVIAFAGSRTQDLMTMALRLSGFEIRDCIQWLYGSGFPKSHNIGKKLPQWEGFGTALKPSYEPAILCRKPIQGTVVENVLKHGVGGLNVDGCRIETSDNLKRTQHARGIWSQEKHTHTTGGDSGRWPSNVIINEEVSEDLKSYGLKSSGSHKKIGKERNINKGRIDFLSGAKKSILPREYKQNQGYVSRYFYCAKVSNQEREKGLDSSNERVNIHPTVKPIQLMRYLCRLITPPGGIILDPFMGSGSTGIGASLEGFHFVGIEREKEYFNIARARIAYWSNTPLTYNDEEKDIQPGKQLTLF